MFLDIYIIDGCDDNEKKWWFDFMSCKENILYVVKKRNSEYNYEVCLFFNLKDKYLICLYIYD